MRKITVTLESDKINNRELREVFVEADGCQLMSTSLPPAVSSFFLSSMRLVFVGSHDTVLFG
jgi:hypothetical protein